MSRFFRLPLVAAAVLALAACDSATDTTADPEIEDATAADVADVVGEESAGVLDALSPEMMPLLGGRPGPGFGPGTVPDLGGGRARGCTVGSTTDAATFVRTVTTTCRRGTADSAAYAQSDRVTTFLFTGPNGPQAEAAGATQLDVAIVSGTALRVWPRRRAEVLSTTAALTTTGLGTGTVTTNGTFARTGRTQRAGRAGATVATDYAVSLTLADVARTRTATGDEWTRSLTGTITGTYTATVTRTAADGTVTTHEVSRDITVDLADRPLAGGHEGRFRLGGRRHGIDLRAGSLVGRG